MSVYCIYILNVCLNLCQYIYLLFKFLCTLWKRIPITALCLHNYNNESSAVFSSSSLAFSTRSNWLQFYSWCHPYSFIYSKSGCRSVFYRCVLNKLLMDYKYPSFFLPPLPPLLLRCFLPFLLLFFHPPILFLLLAFVLFLIVVFKNAPAQLEMSFGKIIVIRLKITTTGRKKNMFS